MNLKENFKPLKNSLEKVNKVEFVSYNFKNDPEWTKEHIGFKAQQLEEVGLDVVVSENKNEDIVHKVVNYNGMVPVLTQSIQELSKTLSTMSKRLEKLEKYSI